MESYLGVAKEEGLTDDEICGKLGMFRLSISSTGHENEEEVTAESVKSKRIRFLPTVEMKKAIQDASFIKIDS